MSGTPESNDPIRRYGPLWFLLGVVSAPTIVIWAMRLGDLLAETQGAGVGLGAAYLLLAITWVRIRTSHRALSLGLAVGASLPIVFMIWFSMTFSFPE